MAQRPTADFNIDPNITSGTDLANILNRFQDAIDSGNSGSSRPAYLEAGGLWVREGDPMRLYLYDGTTDRELYNTTDGIVGAIEDGTVNGQITTWNASSGEWTPEGAVVVDANGYVGIGTDNPDYKLDVSGTINANGLQAKGSPSLSFNANCWMTQQETGHIRTYVCGPDASTYQPWEIYRATSTGSSEVSMVIDASGDVGINTDTPEAKLHIRDLIPSIIFDDQGFATRKARLQSKDANLDIEADYNNGTDYSRMTFRVDNDEKMRLDFRGRLGIGGEPSRSTKEIEEEAEATLRNWDSKDKKPTKAELIKRLAERTIGGGSAKLQVAGDGYFAGNISFPNQKGILGDPAGNGRLWISGANNFGASYGSYISLNSNTATTRPGSCIITCGDTTDAFICASLPNNSAFVVSATPQKIPEAGSAKLQVSGDGYFSGDVYANGSPLTRVGDIVETFRTLKNAVSDETTVEGIKEALTNSLGGLIEKFEAMQSAATQEIES